MSSDDEIPTKRTRTGNSDHLHSSCDVTLIAGIDKKEFAVHRHVMAAWCESLKQPFNERYEELGSKMVIEDVDSRILAAIIDYCYTGHIGVTMKNVDKILGAAFRMGIETVTRKCLRLLLDAAVTFENCVHTYELAEKYSITALRQKAMETMSENFDLIPIGDLQKLDRKVLRLMFTCNNPLCSETNLFENVVIRMENDLINQSNTASDFLKIIELHKFSGEYLVEMVEPVFKKYNYVEAIDNEYKRRVLQQTNSQLITSHPRPKVAKANFSIKLFALYTESRPTTLWKYTSKNGQWKDVSPSPGENNLKEMLIANVGGKYKTAISYNAQNLNCCEWQATTQYAIQSTAYSTQFLHSMPRNAVNKSVVWKCLVEQPILQTHSNQLPQYKHMRLADIRFPAKTKRSLTYVRPYITSVGIGYYVYMFVSLHCNGNSMNCGERFDREQNLWTDIKPMRRNRSDYIAIAASNSMIYIVGGSEALGTQTVSVPWVDRYDPISNSWKEMNEMKNIQKCLKLVQLDDMLYAFGVAKDGRTLAESYDMRQNKWTKIIPIEMERNDMLCDVAIAHGIPKCIVFITKLGFFGMMNVKDGSIVSLPKAPIFQDKELTKFMFK